MLLTAYFLQSVCDVSVLLFRENRPEDWVSTAGWEDQKEDLPDPHQSHDCSRWRHPGWPHPGKGRLIRSRHQGKSETVAKRHNVPATHSSGPQPHCCSEKKGVKEFRHLPTLQRVSFCYRCNSELNSRVSIFQSNHSLTLQRCPVSLTFFPAWFCDCSRLLIMWGLGC